MKRAEHLTPDGLEGCHISILGAGVTGRALEKFCINYGAKVSLVDDRAENSLRHVPDSCELVIVSPGWPPDHPEVEQINSRDIPCVSEIDFAWQMRRHLAPEQRWISLTGTNGKTTTIQMVESIFKSAGMRAVACGNVGRTVIESITPEIDTLAIELSSFQIHWSEQARFEAVAILNISPDHIDWHGSFDAYRDAKLKLIDLADRAVINVADANLSRSWPDLVAIKGSRLIPFHLGTPAGGEVGLVEDLIVDRALVANPNNAEVLVEVESLPSKAPHNISNAMAAATLAKIAGVNSAAIAAGLSQFTIDHHRLEIVADVAGVRWVDDSKATNPHAAMAALLSFPSVIWIAGGLAKGATMEELIRIGSRRIRAAILIGTDSGLIRDAIEKEKPGMKVIELGLSDSGDVVMRRAVEHAKHLASKGDTVLLAPACASLDQFTSYAHRGEIFQAAVREFVLVDQSADQAADQVAIAPGSNGRVEGGQR